jgi:RHS repeat-associated protein
MQTLEMNADFLLTRIKDARGRTVVENDYDAWKRVWQQRTFGDAARTTFIGIAPGVGLEKDPALKNNWTYFDARGRKNFEVDADGARFSAWYYDGVDRLITTIAPSSAQWDYTYDAYHVLTSVTDGDRHTRLITPDSNHRPWKIQNFEGQQTVVTYTAQHRVDTITAPGGIATNFTYDTNGRLKTLHPAAYSAGSVDTYTYDAYGNIDTIKHPDNAIDDYTFNSTGDLLDVTDRKSIKTSFTYNLRRQGTKVSQWNGATELPTYAYYDDVGDLDYVLDASGRKVDLDHDALGNLTELKRGPLANQVTVLSNSYSDSRTLLTTATDGASNSTTFSYYDTQQLKTVKDALNRTTTFNYDYDHRPTTTTTPLNSSSTASWDYSSFLDGVQDAESQIVDYTYDKDGRPTILANRLNKSFTWLYDDTNRTITSKTPLLKTTTASFNTRGLPASVQEPSTQNTTFDTYDAEGRLTQRTDGVGVTTYSYYANGLPYQVIEGGKTTTRLYDAAGRLNSYADGEGNTITYDYYASGELKLITYPGNKTVTYTYDDFGRLWQVSDWASRVTTYTYDNASRLTRIDRPNGTYRTQSYDAGSQLRFIKEYNSSGSLLVYQDMRYDDDGRMKLLFRNPKPAAVAVPADVMEYDDDNQLSKWNSASANVVFDADGNMTTGPLPSGSLGNYGYDSRNRLTSAGSSTYRYNPDGLRVQITGTGAATFVVDPNGALSRTLSRTKGGMTTYYVYGLGLLYEETAGVPKYYHADQVGSTIAITDGSQTVTDRFSYSPFGLALRNSGSTDTPFQFNGTLGVQTDANGLYYMRARYYNPRMMRFVNADPIGFGGGTNWYAYCGNDPVSFADPFGLYVGVDDAVATIGGAAIGLLGQGVADLWHGKVSPWSHYLAAGAGGAVAGEGFLYLGPGSLGLGAATAGAISGAAGAATTSVIRQVSDVNAGRQKSFSGTSLALETTVGAVVPVATSKILPRIVSGFSNQWKGSVGEAIANISVRLKGYTVLANGTMSRSAGGVWVPKSTGASAWIPDMVLEKETEILFVEVKTFTSQIRPNQRWGLENYPSMFIRYDANWFANLGAYFGATAAPGINDAANNRK